MSSRISHLRKDLIPLQNPRNLGCLSRQRKTWLIPYLIFRNSNLNGFLKIINNLYAQVGVRRNSHSWFMDNRCSKYITRKTDCFLSLEALQGGYVLFGDRNKGYILGVGKIEKSLNQLLEDVYYVGGLRHSLLSVSQFVIRTI